MVGGREPYTKRGDNLFPRCELIRGMHKTSNADCWDARVMLQLTPLSLRLSSQWCGFSAYQCKQESGVPSTYSLFLPTWISPQNQPSTFRITEMNDSRAVKTQR